LTDGVTLAVAGVAALVAGVAAWLHHPRTPELDAERWFKVWIATSLRGTVETAGGDADAWVAEVLRFVPYHPAGREPGRKVASPSTWRPADGWIDGEQALVEALARLPDVQARWRWLYDEDERGAEARLVDPQTLGPAYDPRTYLGSDGSWDAVAGGGLTLALVARLGAAWVLVDGAPGPPPLLDALHAAVPDADRIQWSPVPFDAAAAGVLDRLREVAVARGTPLVIVAAGAGAHFALRALAADPGLRDRIAAVVSVGGVLRGIPGQEGPLGEAAVADWMGRWFGHDALSTDALVLTPYLALQWWDPQEDPPGGGLPLRCARWPALRDTAAPESVAPLDLGVLPTDPDLPLAQVADALVGVTVCAVLAWRGEHGTTG
jgi:hypothetical protein